MKIEAINNYSEFIPGNYYQLRGKERIVLCTGIGKAGTFMGVALDIGRVQPWQRAKFIPFEGKITIET